jgi:predicted PhzF superfamily epimerase YddE/YHI9
MGRGRGRVLLRSVLLATSSLREHVQAGVGALSKQDVRLIKEPERPRVGDSLNLDEATRDEHPEDPRWDYLLSVPDQSQIVAMEPHSARQSEVSVVIAKKKWAIAVLRDHFGPRHAVARWLWVSSGTVGFSRMDRERRRLDQHGIEFVGRKVTFGS